MADLRVITADPSAYMPRMPTLPDPSGPARAGQAGMQQARQWSQDAAADEDRALQRQRQQQQDTRATEDRTRQQEDAEFKRGLQVLELADSNPAAARQMRDRYRLNMPDEALDNAAFRGAALTAAKLGYGPTDPDQYSAFIKASVESGGNTSAAMQAAGAPRKPSAFVFEDGTGVGGPLANVVARPEDATPRRPGAAARPAITSSPLPPPSSAPGSGGYADKVAMTESGGRADARNPRSSATGAHQFIEGTWLELMQGPGRGILDAKVGPGADLSDPATRQQVLDLRTDPDVSRTMADAYRNEIGRVLQSKGLPTDDATLYLGHFLGPYGAAAVLQAPDDRPVADYLSADAIQANPQLRSFSVGQMKAWARNRMAIDPAIAEQSGDSPGQPASQPGQPAETQTIVRPPAQRNDVAASPYGLQPGDRMIWQTDANGRPTKPVTVEGQAWVMDRDGSRVLRPLKADALVEIADPSSPTGTRMVTREQALGQPGKPPSSMSLTSDGKGGFTMTQGVGGGGGAGELAKATVNDLEGRLLDGYQRLERLGTIARQFKPEFLQSGTQLENWFNDKVDRVGFDLSPDKRAQLVEYETFRSNAFNELTQTLKDMSGAAVTPQEAERLLLAIGDPNKDGPTVFQAKLNATIQAVKLAQARLYYIRARGMNTENFGGLPLDSMPAIIDRRGDEIEAEVRQANPQAEQAQIDAQVRRRLSSEFGITR